MYPLIRKQTDTSLNIALVSCVHIGGEGPALMLYNYIYLSNT